MFRYIPRKSFILACGLATSLCIPMAGSWAQSVPRSYEASPGIYKVVAENANFRVIEITWKPGERDKLHGHPESAFYLLTDCHTRGYLPNGNVREAQAKAGTAVVQGPVAEHSVENIGSSDCRMVMFERNQ